MREKTTDAAPPKVCREHRRTRRPSRRRRRKEYERGRPDNEVAFYDALAANESASDLRGEQQLLVIAHELVESIKGNITVDGQHRVAVRARLRVLVKRILRRYGDPPDLQGAAVRNVLAQAEATSANGAPIGAETADGLWAKRQERRFITN